MEILGVIQNIKLLLHIHLLIFSFKWQLPLLKSIRSLVFLSVSWGSKKAETWWIARPVVAIVSMGLPGNGSINSRKWNHGSVLICHKILFPIFRVRSSAITRNWLFQFIYLGRQWLESLTVYVHCIILRSFGIIWQVWYIANRALKLSFWKKLFLQWILMYLGYRPYSPSGESIDFGSCVPQLEKETAIHSSILPGKFHGQRSLVGYNPWGDRVRCDLVTKPAYLSLSLSLVTYQLLDWTSYLTVLCHSFFICKMKHLFSVLVLKIC